MSIVQVGTSFLAHLSGAQLLMHFKESVQFKKCPFSAQFEARYCWSA